MSSLINTTTYTFNLVFWNLVFFLPKRALQILTLESIRRFPLFCFVLFVVQKYRVSVIVANNRYTLVDVIVLE